MVWPVNVCGEKHFYTSTSLLMSEPIEICGGSTFTHQPPPLMVGPVNVCGGNTFRVYHTFGFFIPNSGHAM